MGSFDVGRVPSVENILQLQALLHELHRLKCPHLSNPSTCRKRASVALIIRIRPTYPHQPAYDHETSGHWPGSFQIQLDNFFSQPWVRHGDPEILFIKRATRTGDRWTGHVALPGGKRDPEDLDDLETSIREAKEEIGLDLRASHCLPIGNLPERIVTTAWGKVPLMVLCPFVFLLLRHDIPPLTLQPTEVHSAHWVPVRALVSSSLGRFQRCDVSERLSGPSNWVMRFILRAMFGQMLFSATQLIPSESLHCSSVPDFLPIERSITTPSSSLLHNIKACLAMNTSPASTSQHPLLLWGLTLGIVTDLLRPIHSDGASKFWPTFTPWDFRCAVWLFTYSFRTRKLRELRANGFSSQLGQANNRVTEFNGFHLDTYSASSVTPQKVLPSSTVGKMLDGYYNLLKKAVIMTLLLRLGFGTLVIILLRRKFSRSYLHRRVNDTSLASGDFPIL